MNHFIKAVINYLAEKEKRKIKIKKKKEKISKYYSRNEINEPLKFYEMYSNFLPQINLNIPSEIILKRDRKKNKKKIMKKLFSLEDVKERKLSDEDRLKFFFYLYGKYSKESEMEYVVSKEIIDNTEYEFARARISWDEDRKDLIYKAIEPELDEKDKEIVLKTLKILERKLDLPYFEIKDYNFIKEYIIRKSREIWKINRISISKDKEPYIIYYILRDTIGYGKIDILMRDPLVEDISCNGVNIPVFIFHRNPLIGEIKTNIKFENDEELDNFVIKLAIRSGRYVSVSSPLLDASLPDGSRIQITYGKDISRKGSSFTIRRFTKDPMTPIDLLNYGTVDFKILAYLWTLIEEERSLLVAGGTATGKTSFLNAISLFIKPEKKIISIEDTPELQLPHPNWLQEVARPGFGPQKYGEVSLYDLLKAALRQRPDYIIVGEVRGQEAFILFQAMATGHAGLGTIHAESFEGLFDRLISPPISLPPFLLEILDGVVFLKRSRYAGKYVRRVDKIYEIVKYDHRKNKILKIQTSKWNPKNDDFTIFGSYKLKKIAEFRNITMDELKTNINFKIKVLEYLYNNRIRDYKRIAEILKMYYYSPDELAKFIGL
ncbi:MAG: type II/IV secretion system ATPase subunit [Nanopusillaceae archaeon]